jgi:multidrug resistance efflux pump
MTPVPESPSHRDRGEAPSWRGAPASLPQLPPINDLALPSYRIARHALRTVVAFVLVLALAGVASAVFFEMDVSFDATGVIEQRRVWPVRPRQAGLVSAIAVGSGDTVHQEQVIAMLDSSEAASAIRSVSDQLRLERQDLRKATEALPLNSRMAVEKVAEAEANLLRSRARLREGLIDLSMTGEVDSTLKRYVAGTSTRIDLLLADVHTAEAGVRAARIALEAARLDSMDIARRRIELERLLGDSLNALARQERLRIRAPAFGIILTDDVQRLVGSQLQAGESFMEVADSQGWRVVMQIAERDVQEVRVGQLASIELPAIRELDGRRLYGRVESVSAQPVGSGPDKSESTSYRAIISLNPAQSDSVGPTLLRRGYSVRGKIITRRGRIGVLALAYVRDRVNQFR